MFTSPGLILAFNKAIMEAQRNLQGVSIHAPRAWGD